MNHGVEEELLSQMLSESRKFFSLPVEDKMKLARKDHRGYTAMYAENLDPTSSSEGCLSCPVAVMFFHTACLLSVFCVFYFLFLLMIPLEAYLVYVMHM